MVEANDAIELLGPEPLIAEKWIPFQAEVSVLVARNPSGQIATYPMFTNVHSNHILDITTCPAFGEMEPIAIEAQEIARGIAESFRLEGLLCVEFFVGKDGELMVNELAPRPHNSGHLTMEACRTSQFEQQVRAVCNLPLGDTSMIQPAAMVNLLGDVWGGHFPKFENVLSESRSYLHLYGKKDARAGRKMGHITVLDDSVEQASERAKSIRERVHWAEKGLF
jgi:5-(carboxyamino)imidazole ribonucleotide synthase